MKPSETEKNEEVVRSYVAAFNAGDVDTLASLFDPEAAIHGVLATGRPADMKIVWSRLHSSLAANLVIDDMVSQGDVVAVRYTETGRSQGGVAGEATGRAYRVAAMEWFALRDGRIHEWWGARDSAAIQRQIA